MKYLTEELYFAIFCSKDNFYNHNDKFLVGFLNNEKKKLKDVITGEIFESCDLRPIIGLSDMNFLMPYIAGPRLSGPSIRHWILADKINSILSKDLLEEKDIIKIKKILNKEIIRNFEKVNLSREKERERERELKKYSINESEREF